MRLDAAVGQDRRGVVDVVGALGEADDRDDASRVGGDPLDRGARVGEEVLLEQQVLGRVAGDRQLGEERELRAGLACARELLANLGLVAGDVADGGVDLGERDPHSPSPYLSAGSRRRAVAELSARWSAPAIGAAMRLAWPKAPTRAGRRHGELVDRHAQVVGQRLEVSHRVVVAQQAEARDDRHSS